MPTNRTKRVRNFKPQTISPGLRSYFETGSWPGNKTEGDYAGFLMMCSEKEEFSAWEECRDTIMSAWINRNPCSRPWAWWHFDASEPRRRLGGIGTPASDVLAYAPSFSYGIPTRWVSRFDEDYYNGRAKDVMGKIISTDYKEGDFKGLAINLDDPPVYESEAAYLERQGLLTPAERAYLKKHPELMEPEKIKVTISDESRFT